MPKPTADDIRAYIDCALEAWKKEPPTDPYEEGHEAAFRELKEYADTERCAKRIHRPTDKAIGPREG